MTRPVSTAQDRTLHVPAGKIVRTGYVPVEDVRLACRDRMAIGDVDRAYQRRLQMGGDQPWPPPVGEWAPSVEEMVDFGNGLAGTAKNVHITLQGRRRFTIYDGRHEYVATLMLGHSHILVAWLEDAP